MTKERLQKVVASTGQYSRRAVERLIDEKKIKVNGILITAKGVKVDPTTDRIQVDGKAFQYKEPQKATVILINKPRHVLVTRQDTEGRKTVYDLLPKSLQHLKPVGRLDFNTQGALILTDDGDFILKLTHPRYHMDKVYEVKTEDKPDEKQLRRLRQGVLIDDYRTHPCEVDVFTNNKTSSILRFVLQEGKNRQIRRMCEAVGIAVKELKRVAIGPIRLKGLRSGAFRRVTRSELKALEREFAKNI